MRPALSSLSGPAFGLLLVCALLAPAHAQQALRPEIGRPLQQAGELLRAGKAREALAKVDQADAVRRKTAAEQLTIDRMRGAAAQRAGDHATAIRAFEAVLAAGSLPPAEQAPLAESLAYAYSQRGDWARTTQWIERARQAGSTSPQLDQLLAYVRSQTGDHGAVAVDAAAAVAAAEKAGRRPAEADLLRLADAQQRLNQPAAYRATLEKLLRHHPKPLYWQMVLQQLPRQPGFSNRLALDVMRLREASGTLDDADALVEMVQLALHAGFPAEGLALVERGYASGLLGTGAQAERHQRLRTLAKQQADAQVKALNTTSASASASATGPTTTTAPQPTQPPTPPQSQPQPQDAEALVRAGEVQVSLGRAAQGVALIEQGIARGGLKRPDDARLRLGLAMLQSDAHRARAPQVLRSVKGNDGTADIARLWLILSERAS
jgi:tetratricopeptide (TPR) repeat protein